MTKSNLPQAQIQILPSKELEVFYPKPSFKNRLFSREHLGGTIVSIVSLILSIVLMILGIYDDLAVIALAIAASQIPFIIKIKGAQKIVFEKKGLIVTYFNKKIRKFNFENDLSVDFIVKVMDDTVTLTVDEHTIWLDDAKQLPLVIEHITTLWDLEYHETKQVNEAEILTYQKKEIQ
ncbi:MAG: hypothetical protein AB8G11_00380 [Saprospiraceae bacterium]